MLWFKILLMVLLSLGVIGDVLRAGGWKPELKHPITTNTICAILRTLLVVGVWCWL